MLCTFGQAKKTLAKHMGARGLSDPGAAINEACEELACCKNWRALKRTVRLTAETAYFALPQEYESLIKAAVDGTPVTMHGSDIEFLLSGPGDLDYVTDGYAPLNGIQDLGWWATMYVPDAASKLAFFCTSPVPVGKVVVKGVKQDGDIVVEEIAVNEWAAPTDIDTMATSAVPITSIAEFVSIDRIVLPDDAEGYVSLYGIVDSEFKFFSRMHPSVKIPQFRRYRMAGFSAAEGATYKVLAEVRVRFMPLVSDSDVLPFDTLYPVQMMLRSLWKLDADDQKGSLDLRALAEAALIKREDVQEERAGVVVVNSVYDGSPGQASNDTFDNL